MHPAKITILTVDLSFPFYEPSPKVLNPERSENQLHLWSLSLVQPGYLPGWLRHGVAPRSPLGAAPRSLSGAEPILTTVHSSFEFGDNYLLITSPNLMPERLFPLFSPKGSSGNSPKSGLSPGILYSSKGNVFCLMTPFNTRAESKFSGPNQPSFFRLQILVGIPLQSSTNSFDTLGSVTLLLS